jgi:hypothetical protein
MSKQKNFGADFNNLPDTSHLKKITLSSTGSKQNHSIENIPGKQASVKILYNISHNNDFKITVEQAKAGIILFGDYVEEEMQQPNLHPNIRLLLDIIKENQVWEVEAT